MHVRMILIMQGRVMKRTKELWSVIEQVLKFDLGSLCDSAIESKHDIKRAEEIPIKVKSLLCPKSILPIKLK